jgi:hypothetical protein
MARWSSKLRSLKRHIDWILIPIVFLVGVVLLAGASVESGPVGEEGSLAHDLTRDTGIAFIVAAIVGGAFELYARNVLQDRTMNSVLDATVGEMIGPDIWQDVHSQILNKDVIRRNIDIHLKLFEDPEANLPPGAMAVWMKMTYDLFGLGRAKKEVEVKHWLDAHIKARGLPRYNKFEV